MENSIREKLEKLAEEVQKNMTNPDVDIEFCFDGASEPPHLIVNYVVEEHSINKKRIDIDPEYLKMDLKDLTNFIVFQIEQYMAEIDSVEYGGD
jgi:hypothetical protein